VIKKVVFLTLLVSLVPQFAFGWGKRGHEIVASVAARLLEENQHADYLKEHEFDLGYYANVPDLVWRNISKEIGATEAPQHYIDWTKAMAKAFGSPKNLPLEFSEFKEKMGADYDFKLGVVPYRIHDLIKRCKKITETLTKETQGPLLVCLGELSHYTGDISMPLHTSENHDGDMTHQHGIHVYFEGNLVNALDPQLKIEVLEKARKLFGKHVTSKMNSDTAVRWLIEDSNNKVDELLNLDHGLDRTNINAAKNKYHTLIVNRLVEGVVVTAEIWSEILANVKGFDETKFYFFDGKPEYVDPGKE